MPKRMYLEPLVLKDTLDGGVFARGRKLGLKDDAEGSIAYDLALRVLQIPRLSSDAILHLLANDLCKDVIRYEATHGALKSLPPILRLCSALGRFVDIAWAAALISSQRVTCSTGKSGGLTALVMSSHGSTGQS